MFEKVMDIMKHLLNLRLLVYSLSVYLVTAVYKIDNFRKSGSTDYCNFVDYLLLPLLAVVIFSGIYIFLTQTLKPSISDRVDKILQKQSVISYIYVLYFIAELNLEQLITYHLIIGGSVLCNDLIGTFFAGNRVAKRVVFLVLVVSALSYLTLTAKTRVFFDSFSEDCTYNAAYYYNEKNSWFKYALLPVIAYPGAPTSPLDNSKEWIYTHYPAAPFVVLGLLYKILGPDETHTYYKYRIFPGIIFIISFIFLTRYYKIVCNDDIYAFMLSFITVMQPAVDFYKLNLHYQSYSMSLLFVQLFAVMKYLQLKNSRYLFYTLVCIFIQGWLTFDFIPLVIIINIALIPLYLLLKEDAKLSMKDFFPFICSCITYFVVIITRLIQNMIYYGSVSGVLNDLKDSFMLRTTGSANALYAPPSYYIFSLAKSYRDLVNTNEVYFNFPLIDIYLFVAFIFLVLAIYKISVRFPHYTLTPSVNSKIFLWLLTSFICGITWIALMKNHARDHFHFLPRHFIVLFIGLTSLVALLINKYKNPGERCE
jgi:hypothetical protein